MLVKELWIFLNNMIINDKETLAFYLAADKFALGKKRKRPRLFSDEIWKFQILLRKCEYYKNTNSHSLLSFFSRFKFHRLSVKLGFSIPLNCIGPGMKINHIGTVILNGDCHIGKWCDIHPGVCVGSNPVLSENGEIKTNVPTIGGFVYLGPGAKLFGDIVVGNQVMVGANAVVNKDVDNDKIVYGNPMVVKENHHNVLTTANKIFEQSFVSLCPQYEKFLI